MGGRGRKERGRRERGKGGSGGTEIEEREEREKREGGREVRIKASSIRGSVILLGTIKGGPLTRTCSTLAMIKTHSSANKLQRRMKTEVERWNDL